MLFEVLVAQGTGAIVGRTAEAYLEVAILDGTTKGWFVARGNVGKLARSTGYVGLSPASTQDLAAKDFRDSGTFLHINTDVPVSQPLTWEALY